MSIAQRAIAASGQPLVQDVPRDPTDRDRLREEWRIEADRYVEMDDLYQRYKEGKTIFRDELIETLVENGMAAGKAERTANISQAYKDYLRKMHDARRAAALQKNEMEDRDRVYWSHVSKEATNRKEMGMTGRGQ